MKARRSFPHRGAVLLIVLLAMMFAVAALVFFIERATPDLLVEKKEASSYWLRRDAQGAIEASLAVLAGYQAVLGELHHPAEGWSDPLSVSDYVPGEGRKVTVTVSDESGRIPLVNTDYTRLVAIFRSWGMVQRDAERCADALLVWTKKDHVPRVLLGSEDEEYKRGEIPYQAPARPLHSYGELASIAVVREMFFDERGLPNEYYVRFVAAFSLLDYSAPNINAAVPEVMVDLSGLSDTGAGQRLADFRSGKGGMLGRSGGYFRSNSELEAVLGRLPDDVKVSTGVQVLRVEVVVSEGESRYHLSALVTPPGKAKWPKGKVKSADPTAKNATTAEPTPAEAADGGKETPNSSPSSTPRVKYPFEILEITEHDGLTARRETATAAPAP